jgi:hypothetical protein
LSFQQYSQEKTLNFLLYNTQWQWGVQVLQAGIAWQVAAWLAKLARFSIKEYI